MSAAKRQAKHPGKGTQILSKEMASSLNISSFLDWWGQGLLGCLPRRVRQWFWRETTSVVLEPQGSGVRVQRERGESRENLGFYEGAGQWDNLLEEDTVLVFRLPPGQVLSKSLVLPSAAEENLRQVLAFEMERHTPFAVNQVYYDFAIRKRNLATRQIVVSLIVVPRRILDEWLERLSHWGLQPAVVDVAGADREHTNLLPEEKRSSKARPLPRLNMGLGLALILLLAAAILLPLWQARTVVIELMPRVAAAQQKAESVMAIRQQLEKVVEASAFLGKEKHAYPSAVELLYELTHILPDNVWLQQLTFSRGRAELDIRGEAAEASALIALLEVSPYFQSVQFRSPVTTNARTGRDRFHITAQIPKLEEELPSP
ncbi:PilN domain-containing protein [Nitrosococcus watsonii]|uniref:Fimbrial assembly family protein n=1 Tax=Nitrosococcus watsoni (strain C-113) TaxID=105559 RepID=D8K935_NITWC|nr:PilN domain-containing protein [Nitrosococcus watsonii]ADJ29178.1 Fimbrial assembly family protein [Nitrosococcus watsonii C-113]